MSFFFRLGIWVGHCDHTCFTFTHHLTSLKILDLANNSISDLAPLVANTGLGSGDRVIMNGNPLSAASINTHIPALQVRGVEVNFGALKPAVEKEESSGLEEWEADDYIFRRQVEKGKDALKSATEQ